MCAEHSTNNDDLKKLLDLIKNLEVLLQNGEDQNEFLECWNQIEREIKKVNLVKADEKTALYSKIEKLTSDFMEVENIDGVMSTIQCSFDLSRRYFEGDIWFEQQQKFSETMLEIANWMVREERGDLFGKKHLLFLEEILHEMQTVTGDKINAKIKYQAITKVCLDNGRCCLKICRYVKAKEIFENAIFLTESIFGNEAFQDPSLNACYWNLGVAFQKMQNEESAIKAFKKAEKLKQQAALQPLQ